MKSAASSVKAFKAFTLVELLALIAVLALLSTLLLPALTRAKTKSFTAQCLSNKKEIQAGCAMYSADFNDYLVQNDRSINLQGWMFANNENWGTSDANTNFAQYATGTMAPYINNNILLYRCPADLIPSANGFRLRSISMNIQVGETLVRLFLQILIPTLVIAHIKNPVMCLTARLFGIFAMKICTRLMMDAWRLP